MITERSESVKSKEVPPKVETPIRFKLHKISMTRHPMMHNGLLLINGLLIFY